MKKPRTHSLGVKTTYTGVCSYHCRHLCSEGLYLLTARLQIKSHLHKVSHYDFKQTSGRLKFLEHATSVLGIKEVAWFVFAGRSLNISTIRCAIGTMFQKMISQEWVAGRCLNIIPHWFTLCKTCIQTTLGSLRVSYRLLENQWQDIGSKEITFTLSWALLKNFLASHKYYLTPALSPPTLSLSSCPSILPLNLTLSVPARGMVLSGAL